MIIFLVVKLLKIIENLLEIITYKIYSEFLSFYFRGNSLVPKF